MGLEDYGVVLKSKPKKPVFPGETEPPAPATDGSASPHRATVASVTASLEARGFVYQPAPVEVGPAALAEASKNEIRLTARQKLEGAAGAGTAADEVIVEALIRTRAGDSAARPAFGSLSLRFAICQPEGAGWHFLKLVRQICDELSLAVVYGERTYAPEVFWAFRLRANEQIRNQEETWQQLFEQDTERLTIGVDDMWSHFLKKHPAMVEAEPEAESAERTLPPAKIAAESCTDIDTEETMPSSLAKAVSALRKTET